MHRIVFSSGIVASLRMATGLAKPGGEGLHWLLGRRHHRIVTRLISADLSRAWGQPIVIENRPGAGGQHRRRPGGAIEARRLHAVMGSGRPARDQCELVQEHAVRQPQGPGAGLAVAHVPNMLVFAPRAIQVNTFQELIALLKANPGKYFYASTGNGTSSHLSGELLKLQAGVEITHVPYRVRWRSTTCCRGESVHFMFADHPVGDQHVRSASCGARGDERAALRGASPSCRPLPSRATPGSTPRRGSGWWARRGCRESWSSAFRPTSRARPSRCPGCATSSSSRAPTRSAQRRGNSATTCAPRPRSGRRCARLGRQGRLNARRQRFAGWAVDSRKASFSESVMHHAKRAVIDWHAALLPGAVVPPATLLEKSLSEELDRGGASLALGRKATRRALRRSSTAPPPHTVEVDDIYREASTIRARPPSLQPMLCQKDSTEEAC